MTAQIPDSIIYQNERLFLCGELLTAHFESIKVKPTFKSPHTALWRGYIGSWEIRGDELYLNELQGWMEGGVLVDLSFFFPSHPNGVFANWVTGVHNAVSGKQLSYVHSGYESIYEHEFSMHFSSGKLLSCDKRTNSQLDVEQILSKRDYQVRKVLSWGNPTIYRDQNGKINRLEAYVIVQAPTIASLWKMPRELRRYSVRVSIWRDGTEEIHLAGIEAKAWGNDCWRTLPLGYKRPDIIDTVISDCSEVRASWRKLIDETAQTSSTSLAVRKPT